LTHIDLSGKTAFVTGGNVGIGKAVAVALARCGANIALTYLSHAGQETVMEIQTLGRTAVALQMDATDSVNINRVVAEAAGHLGGHIDILVNNAGGLVGRVPVAEMDDAHWHKVIDLNLSSAFYCTRAVLPYMTTGWGRIVNVSSLAAQNGGGAGAMAYSASKAGMLGMTRGLAKELAPQGITVNAVAPGLILDTPFHETFTSEENQRMTIESTPLKRPGTPDDVAGVVVYLASDLASFVTGDTTAINGGTWFA
jgi:3-oxoacyl-[acyl-carrier protein] reductase